MDRKGALVAAGLGCSLVVVEALLALLVGIIMRTPLLQWTRIVPVFASVGQIGAGYFWWRLFRHPSLPLKQGFKATIRTAGVLYLLPVLALFAIYPIAYRQFWAAPILLVHVVAVCCLFGRPRLLAVWVISAVSQASLFVLAAFVAYPADFALYLSFGLALPVNGLAFGTIVGLPLAWLWPKRSEE